MRDEAVPDEQDDDCANHRANQSRALVPAIPSDGLTNERGDECAGDTEQGRENKTGGIVRARRQHAGDNAGDETNYDDPKNVHGDLHVRA
jgi:hypothetical protein